MNRRTFVASSSVIASHMFAVSRLANATEPHSDERATENILPKSDSGWSIQGDESTAKALEMAAKTYAANRRKDLLSSGNPTGYRMIVSRGYPLAMGMVPDTTFGMLGSRYLSSREFLDTLAGHADTLPRNMRRNGKFFINEDLVAGADRVMTQVMYPIWVWELFCATGDRQFVNRHAEPIQRCLSYIESRTDQRGVVNQVDADDWQNSEGADWVDWCPERMEGSTCVYHTWYVRALECCVALFGLQRDSQYTASLAERLRRQRRVVSDLFWNGKQFYDNIHYRNSRVANFWCDSQIWPIAFGLSSAEQSQAIFARLDAEPDAFMGCGLRWCAPVEGDQGHRPLTWFGRLGAGLVLARCRTDQPEKAWQTVTKFTSAVNAAGTFPECFDMLGRPQFGSGGDGDYLEHAAGLIYCLGRGIMGIDDTADQVIRWNPMLPKGLKSIEVPFWRNGHCWRFSYADGNFSVDPGGDSGVLDFQWKNVHTRVSLTGSQSIVPID